MLSHKLDGALVSSIKGMIFHTNLDEALDCQNLSKKSFPSTHFINGRLECVP